LIHNRRTRFDLRRALQCDLAAGIGRTLAQSTRTLTLSGRCPRDPSLDLRMHCSHRFQHDCNLRRAYAFGSGNLTMIESCRVRLRANGCIRTQC
jgi:hypothetical protein